MSRSIPNTGPAGNDYCLDPVLFEVPLIIVENGDDCFWFHESMDPSAADRMAYAMTFGATTEAHRVNVKLILPSASQVRAATADLTRLNSDPVRVKLKAEQRCRND